MPKVTLHFTLPEEKNELLMAQRGADWYSCLTEIDRIMRQHRKYDKHIKECWEEIGQVIMDARLDEVE